MSCMGAAFWCMQITAFWEAKEGEYQAWGQIGLCYKTCLKNKLILKRTMEPHAWNPSTWEFRVRRIKFKASTGYMKEFLEASLGYMNNILPQE